MNILFYLLVGAVPLGLCIAFFVSMANAASSRPRIKEGFCLDLGMSIAEAKAQTAPQVEDWEFDDSWEGSWETTVRYLVRLRVFPNELYLVAKLPNDADEDEQRALITEIYYEELTAEGESIKRVLPRYSVGQLEL